MKKINLILNRTSIFVFVLMSFVDYVTGQNLVPMQQLDFLKVKLQTPVNAYPFPAGDVSLLDSKFKQTMEVDERFLFNLEPDRLLSSFRSNAGLEPKAEKYGGWESGGLAGHSLGHYLSALSLLYSSTSSPEALKRINHIVSELKEIQSARKTGYLGAIPDEDRLWEEVKNGKIETANFSLNGYWAPWYTVHKIMAGLLDAYIRTGNKDALEIEVKFCDWADELLSHLDEPQMQNMLRCEYGGMAEVLVNTYAVTGNKKYLDLSYRFYDNPILDPLAKHEDRLSGFHANTIIPKAIGSIRRYEVTNDRNDLEAGKFFWETVVKNHTYAIGGNSYYEYFHDPGKLNDKLADNTTETCNTYNMLKLTQHLFGLQPSAHLMDFYEKALYNHILASQNPETGMTTYYVSLRMGGKKHFGDYRHSFTCCMGTGMENHVKYNENIYYKGKDGSLYVNLFIPSELNWREKGIKITQNTNIPENDSTVLTMAGKNPGKFPVRIRKPYWAKQATVCVNGKKYTALLEEDGYLVVDRKWNDGDRISIYLPGELHYEAMPDNPDRRALFFGPVILAGDFGKDPLDPDRHIPVFVTAENDANQWLKRENNLTFTSGDNTFPGAVELRPFNEMVNEHYTVYWDFFTPEQWTVRQKEYEAEQLERQDIETRTVSLFRPGEMQPERDHNLQGDKMYTGESNQRKWRAAAPGGYLSFEMQVSPENENVLTMTYWGKDNRNSTFHILVDDTVIATEDINKYKENRFYEIDYKISIGLTKGKERITLTLKGARENDNTGPFYQARITRENSEISEVPFTDVHFNDEFWAPRMEVNRTVSIPSAFYQCEINGRFDNFALAGGLIDGEHQGDFSFDDTDPYKIIEGASYSLAVKYDPKLDAYMDSVIALIAAAQEEDGYLTTCVSNNCTRLSGWWGASRWERINSHELYNCGHLYEAAVAHYKATRKRTLLDVAIKNADLVCRVFGLGEGQVKYPSGHPIIEMALVKLYHVTGDKKYLDQARYFVDEAGRLSNGRKPGIYSQDHKPVLEQEEIVGHAVRAGYFYSGVTDVSSLQHDRKLFDAVNRVWENMAGKKLYISGGIGSRAQGEGFGPDYELNNFNNYCETCASIANVYWNQRMFLATGHSKYIDVLERSLYNGVISGVSSSGDKFFYDNPLASHGEHERQKWFGCACCPGNITRFMASIPGYTYATHRNSVYVNLFVKGNSKITLEKGEIELEQITKYPWEGNVDIQVNKTVPEKFVMHIRIPGWVRNQPVPTDLYKYADGENPNVSVAVNGKPVKIKLTDGYLVIDRKWEKGDKVSLHMDMPVRRTQAHEKVTYNEGLLSMERGPVLYALESIDQPEDFLFNIVIPRDSKISSRFDKALLNGVVVLEGEAFAVDRDSVSGQLRKKPFTFKAIPYSAWNNRGKGQLVVWTPEKAEYAILKPEPTIASQAEPVDGWGYNDRFEPKSSSDLNTPYHYWWLKQGSEDSVGYKFSKPEVISSVEVYWLAFDHYDVSYRAPESWKLLYKEGNIWKEVENPSGYGVEPDQYNKVTFDPVTTSELKLLVQLQRNKEDASDGKDFKGYSGGVIEWKVY